MEYSTQRVALRPRRERSGDTRIYPRLLIANSKSKSWEEKNPLWTAISGGFQRSGDIQKMWNTNTHAVVYEAMWIVIKTIKQKDMYCA